MGAARLDGLDDACLRPASCAGGVLAVGAAVAVLRSCSLTGCVAQNRPSLCWHRGQASRPSASTRQPAAMTRARMSASPSAAGSVCQEMHEPISHHMIGILS